VDNVSESSDGLGDGGAIGTDGALDPDFRSDTVGGTIQICGTTIRNSQGYGAGGAAYLWCYPPDQVIIARTTVEGNTIGQNYKGNCMGGAMRVSNCEITIKNSSYLTNRCEGNGGAL
jgi:hypothetical protein